MHNHQIVVIMAQELPFFCTLPRADIATIWRLAREGFVPKWAIVSQAIFVLSEAKKANGRRAYPTTELWNRLVKAGGPRRKARGGRG